MKYVRIKDNIYHITDKECLKTKKENHPLVQIIKESDKLEELCDEFVYKDLYDYKISKNIIDMLDNKDKIKFYGAIWTKGEDGEPILKSVAKMNTEGELELL